MAIKHKRSLGHRIINTFLPTRHNAYKPWIAEIPGLIIVTTVLIFIHVASNGILVEKFIPDTDHYTKASIKLLNAVNQQRAASGARDLVIDERLVHAAEAKVDHMFQNQYWAHVSPDNVAAWSFIQNEKYFYRQSAENLARGFATPEGAVAGWYSSESHKEAMLDPVYKNVGFAVRRGKLGNEITTLYVALFADPLNGATIVNGEDSRQSLTIQGDAAGFIDNATTVNFSLVNPVSLHSTLSLPGKISLVILGLLAIVYISQHAVMARKQVLAQLGFYEKPLLKLLFIVLAILLIVATSFGSIS